MNTPSSKSYPIKQLNSDDLYSILQKLLQRQEQITSIQRYFWIVGLAYDNRILFVESINLEALNQSSVEPMEVFSMALQKRASKVVLCHNHPDGDLKPTPEDRDLTDRLIQVGRIINLPVLDHLVISERSYLSFDDLGLMQELAQSIKYVPSYELVVRVRAEMEALMERRIAEAHKNATYAAKEAEKIDIAKALKASGMAVERVAKFTGLSVEVVARL